MINRLSVKMFGRIVRKKKEAPVVINVFLDCPTYDRFKDYVAKNSLDESNALIKVLERGMTNYWLHWYKQLRKDYTRMRDILEEYKKDNELLEAIENQNEQLKKIMEEKATKSSDNLQS